MLSHAFANANGGGARDVHDAPLSDVTAAASLASSPIQQVAGEKARDSTMRRAICDGVRDATAFGYCARVRVSFVCLAARSNGRHCVRSHLQHCACAVIARRLHARHVKRATRARQRCRVATCAREVCSANAGATDAPARRRWRAAIHMRAVSPSKQ